jgi:hypothetical protein
VFATAKPQTVIHPELMEDIFRTSHIPAPDPNDVGVPLGAATVAVAPLAAGPLMGADSEGVEITTSFAEALQASIAERVAPQDATVVGADVVARVQELKAAIPVAQRGRITMAVGLAEDENGVEQTLISTSEPNGYLRRGVTLRPGEILVQGTGHAEMDIVNHARAMNLYLKLLGATRPVCQDCANGIAWGVLVVTPLRNGVF